MGEFALISDSQAGEGGRMEQVEIQARAKINLALDVLGKRPDGYHEVRMIMQSIELADQVILSARPSGIALEITGAELAADQSNLAYRAAALLQADYPHCGGVHISLKKVIPLAAGLAGGSADAAAVLRGLNELWNLGLSDEVLCRYGAQLGSDIPFCITGGTQLAEGRGEMLTKLPALPPCWVVLVKPPFPVATAWVYGQFRGEQVTHRPDTDGMMKALADGDLAGVLARLDNLLETVTIPAYPVLGEIKQALRDGGAAAALMSGSGPTVFGIVTTAAAANRLTEDLRRNYPDSQVFAVQAGEEVAVR